MAKNGEKWRKMAKNGDGEFAFLGGGGQWRKMAKNGDGEFGFFICQIRHFSPIFDYGISLSLSDSQSS